jgi:hypothetical protein
MSSFVGLVAPERAFLLHHNVIYSAKYLDVDHAFFAVLGVSFAVEGYSLFVATRSVMQGAAAHNLTFFQFLQRGLDPTSIAVMLEDGAAVTGLVIAGTRQSQYKYRTDCKRCTFNHVVHFRMKLGGHHCLS